MMDQLNQPSCNSRLNPSTCIATADDKKNAARVFGRSVSLAGDDLFGVNPTDFRPDPITRKKRKDVGIASRVAALEIDSLVAAKKKPKFKKFKAIPGTSTAIISDKQFQLIQRLLDEEKGRFTIEEFIEVIDFLDYYAEEKLPEDFFKSPTLVSGIIRNQLWKRFAMEGSDEFWEVLASTPEREKELCLTRIRKEGIRPDYSSFPEELKKDIDFLTECSSFHGIPCFTPPQLAVQIYERLDIAAKIKSINILPESFKDDDFYDELIRSGRIEISKLPFKIRDKNREYCLLQLSKGLCRLSQVPAQFITKKVVLDSLNSDSLHADFINILRSDSEFETLKNDPDFFEEFLLKMTSSVLEARYNFYTAQINTLSKVYQCCIEKYSDDREKLALLLKRLIRTNPFFILLVKDVGDQLFQELIEEAKESLLEILDSMPEVSHLFFMPMITRFFNKVNASNDFKNQVINVVYPYFPVTCSEPFSEDIKRKQDALVLGSEPFKAGAIHIISRKLRPAKADIIIDYIESYPLFLSHFNDKGYFEERCADPAIRQRLIHVLANKVIANKQQLVTEWPRYLPRHLIDGTLAYLNNPALLSELDVSRALTKPVNPLKLQQPNTLALRQVASLKGNSLQIADKDASCQLQSEFDRADHTNFKLVYPGQHQHSLSLFEREGTIVGGRTLAVQNGEQVDFYKFQRIGESEATLAQEGIMHQFIAKSGRFKSQKPRFGEYIMVLEKDLPESIPGFTDRLQVSEINGERAFRVYHFKATENYAKYAHTPDATDNPYAIAERGLLNGIHDIGVLNGSVGVMPTSTIPAFHATGRRWVFLSALLGNSDFYAWPLPGTFGGWVKAIERPDFGWDGLRDWGDVEFYGSMKSGLTARDSKTSGYTPELLQRLSFVNSLCENLLAAVLLRARLRRDSSDYHYQNQQAVEETENFIEQLLDEYLSGLLAKEKESPPRPRLQELMGLDDTTYRSWLKRTAEEILYWTAKQPYEAKGDSALDPSIECFSKHIKETGNLDATLYPEGLQTFDMHKKFPKDFHNVNDELNLGANNAVFPLVALVKGLTLLAGNIFAYAGQYTEEENKE
ncbi:hypothetical protein [Endozoicomonas sp. ALD040]|uniref:hypothetical protein n=1 Tax=Endozoicomonas sp. ALD040 TaxID=3403079 RepID=UPI003BAEDBAB